MTKLTQGLVKTVLTGATLLIPRFVFAANLEVIEGDIDIATAIQNIGNWAAGLAAAIAVGYLIYGGFLYITGGEKGATAAKQIIVNSIIGLFIIALAAVIVNLAITAIGQLQ